MNYLDYEIGEAFDPQNLEHWLLIVSIAGMLIYAYWLVSREG